MIDELWHSERSDDFAFFARNEHYDQWRGFLEPDSALVWTIDASSHFEAMRARNEYLGWGPYVPEPDWQDIVYP